MMMPGKFPNAQGPSMPHPNAGIFPGPGGIPPAPLPNLPYRTSHGPMPPNPNHLGHFPPPPNVQTSDGISRAGNTQNMSSSMHMPPKLSLQSQNSNQSLYSNSDGIENPLHHSHSINSSSSRDHHGQILSQQPQQPQQQPSTQNSLPQAQQSQNSITQSIQQQQQQNPSLQQSSSGSTLTPAPASSNVHPQLITQNILPVGLTRQQSNPVGSSAIPTTSVGYTDLPSTAAVTLQQQLSNSNVMNTFGMHNNPGLVLSAIGSGLPTSGGNVRSEGSQLNEGS
jgi:hypothetical protein